MLSRENTFLILLGIAWAMLALGTQISAFFCASAISFFIAAFRYIMEGV